MQKARRNPEELPQTHRTAGAVGGLFEGFLRDAMINGAVFFSLIVVVWGVLTQHPAGVVVGVVAGGIGIVLPWLALGRKWSASAQWTTVLAVLATDIAVMILLWVSF